jgi:hypothetical protein
MDHLFPFSHTLTYRFQPPSPLSVVPPSFRGTTGKRSPTTQPHNDTTIRLSDYRTTQPLLLHSFRGINKKLTLIPLTGHPLTIQDQNSSPSPHLFFYLFLEINSFPTHPSPIINQQSSINNLLFLFLFLRIKSPPFHSRIRHGSPFVPQE